MTFYGSAPTSSGSDQGNQRHSKQKSLKVCRTLRSKSVGVAALQSIPVRRRREEENDEVERQIKQVVGVVGLGFRSRLRRACSPASLHSVTLRLSRPTLK